MCKEMKRNREEEVSVVKRRYAQTTEHEAVLNSPDWENIPFTGAVHVFRYLRNKDRIKMAQVCRKWHAIFKDPSLWRKKKMVFDGKLDQRHILFTSLFGGCIQKVRLVSWHEDNTCKIIAESFKNVLENLKSARLRHFELIELFFETFEMFPEQKNIIIRCLKEMFQSQTGLKTVVISSSNFDPSTGTEILDNMATYTGHGLERLYLYHYLSESENLPVCDLDVFKETLTKFNNLKHVSVNYIYISDEVLRHWAVNLHHKLESMEIYVTNTQPYSHIITEETWRKLRASCPKLKVDIRIFDFSSANQILHLLQPSVPLNYFLFSTHEQDLQFSVTLKHLAKYYGDRLEYLWLSFFGGYNNNIDNELAYLIKRCRYQLKSFKFSGNLGIMVPNAILELLVDSQSVLRTVGILCLGENDPEIVKKLKLIGAILTSPKDYVLNDNYDSDEDFHDIDIWM